MEATRPKYAIGQQDFKSLREIGAVYVDKTQFARKIIDDGGRYYFLARPRRFGKSLFLSMLRYLFEGERELFKGLYIDSTDWNWESYPVLRLDLNPNRYDEPGLLDEVLDNLFKEWEEYYKVVNVAEDLSVRFRNIIKAAHENTGRQVVVLVDEYDKPLVGNLNNDENFEHYRARLASIYSNFKSSAEHIRLVFLTGVSRFSKLSVFSDLNNIRDITFVNEFADICGITEKELIQNFSIGIENLADEYATDRNGILKELKRNYDGYRFAKKGSGIYNPWSVLNAMQDKEISNYWSRTGKPTIIAEALKNNDADLEKTLNSKCPFRILSGMDLKSVDPTALLYQTGYLTIKDYDVRTDTVTLGIPNKEVKESLLEELLPFYVSNRRRTPEGIVFDIMEDIRNGEPDNLVKDLDIFLAGIPYDMKMEEENNLHNALYILLTWIGVEVETEVHTSEGRIDLLVRTPKFIYIIELKFGHSSKEAISQIKEKEYALRYMVDRRRLFLIGLNFSTRTRHLDPPVIEEIIR